MYKTDYSISRKQENRFNDFLVKKYKMKTEMTAETEYFPYWDISATGKTKVVKFEVKFQTSKEKVYVEDGQVVNEKIIPTCLSLTTADYYVFTFKNDENFYLLKTDWIKKQCYQLGNPKRKIFFDKNNFRLFVFDQTFIKQNAQTLTF